MTYFLGIDYGTSQFKIHLYNLKGRTLAAGGGNVPLDRSIPGRVEQDMELGWQEVCRTIREVVDRAAIDPIAILGIGTTGTTNINLLGEDGRPLRPAVLYGDERIPTHEDLQRIEKEIGLARIGEAFGFSEPDEGTLTILLRLLPTSKLLWLRKYEPQIFLQAKQCVTSSWDYVNARLTGNIAHWRSSLEIDREIGDLFDLPADFYGMSRETGEVVGYVSHTARSECGLAAGTPVIMGATDSLISFLGAGVNRPSIALNASGTTDVVAVSISEPPQSQVGYPVEHILKGLWLLSLSPIRGPTLAWFKETLLPPGATYADLDRLAAGAPAGSDGLVCLPYFSGEKGLVHNPLARGALVGLDLHHGPAHIARAGLEGIALSLRQILDGYHEQGVVWDEVRLCGGGAGSDFWNQIKADILGREVNVMQVLETGCLGAAMVASVAVGVHADLEAASEELSEVRRVLEPNPAYRDIYEGAYEAFQRVYPAMDPALDPLQALTTSATSGAH